MHTAKRITYKESYLFNIYLGYKFKYLNMAQHIFH